MHGDFSRDTFDPKKHYDAVLNQQGRVQLDADWNEQQAINQHRDKTEATDVIGTRGVPKVGGGFSIGITADSRDLTIAPGRLYVDGLLCENEQPVLLTTQPDLPLRQAPLAGFQLPTQNGRYLMYLDVWQRHITALDDVRIRETALGGVDTTTRSQTVWQVKWLAVAPNATCSQFGQTWKPRPDSQGTLTAQTAIAPASSGPCVLPSTAGYRRLENQLYRVEIHRGGPRNQATFKWSRDNGSVVTGIESISGQTLTVQDVGRDAILGFANGQWVEVFDDRMELAGQHRPNDPTESNAFPDQRGFLVQIDNVNPATREVLIKATTPLPALDTSRHAKLRRWDHTASTADGLGMANTWIPLEDGIEVLFSDSDYTAGDYWLIPARTAISGETGGIEWPQSAPNTPLPQPPNGIQHHYFPLALVQLNGSTFQLVADADCRQLFPALTALTADDVQFNNGVCNFSGATTVQDALNALCQQRQSEGTCTVSAVPEPGWETVFDQIPDGQDAQVCFGVGTYPLDNPVFVRRKGNLTLSGSGAGSRIMALKSEAALVFVDCRNVVVRDLHVQTGKVSSSKIAGETHLNGTLTFAGCSTVTVESVSLKCAAGAVRAAACITVRDRETYAANINEIPQVLPVVRIQHNRLRIGYQQVGMLLVNVMRAQVEDNLLQTAEKPKGLTLAALLENKVYRSAVRSLLLRNPLLGDAQDSSLLEARPADLAVISVQPTSDRTHQVWFNTDPSLVSAWQRLMARTLPKGVQSDRHLFYHLKHLADRILLNLAAVERGQIGEFRGFRVWSRNLLNSDAAYAAQGIVVGGQTAKDIRILNNTIRGVAQGIHVGLSHRGQARTELDMDRAGTVQIVGNNVGLILSPFARDRHGIFVGSCDSLIVQNNYSEVMRLPVTLRIPIEGIRLFGTFGRMMVVRQNHLDNYSVGIRFVPLGAVTGTPQWIITDNVTPTADNIVVIDRFSNKVRGTLENFA